MWDFEKNQWYRQYFSINVSMILLKLFVYNDHECSCKKLILKQHKLCMFSNANLKICMSALYCKCPNIFINTSIFISVKNTML